MQEEHLDLRAHLAEGAAQILHALQNKRNYLWPAYIYTMISDDVVVDRLCLLHDHSGSRQTI